jgi:hypothetical protein
MWNNHKLSTAKNQTPRQLVFLAERCFYYGRYDPASNVFSDIINSLEEEYPGNGPYSTAICPVSDSGLQQFDMQVQKPSLEDDDKSSTAIVLHALTVLSNIISSENACNK